MDWRFWYGLLSITASIAGLAAAFGAPFFKVFGFLVFAELFMIGLIWLDAICEDRNPRRWR